ncbi:MAG: ParE family toxin-like protein [Rudaea sp.]
MKHSASSSFWAAYHALPRNIQALADKSYLLLKQNPSHPSLHFKPIGRYWSIRIGLQYRALGVSAPDRIVWFWIGSHTEYERIICT